MFCRLDGRSAQESSVGLQSARQSTVELRDLSVVQTMRVREVTDTAERERLWKVADAVYSRFAEYRTKAATHRTIPMFVAERVSER